MIQAKIKCYSCGNEFFVYQNDSKSHDRIICPHCLTEMDSQMVNKVYALMGEADDLNRDFRKYASEQSNPGPLFQVNVESVEDPISFECLKNTHYKL